MPSKKQLVKKTISFEQVHPVPYVLTFTPGAQRKLQDHLHEDNLQQFLGNYIAATVTNCAHGVVPENLQTDTWEDDFGGGWKGAAVDRGAPLGHPLQDAPSLKDYHFPDPGDARRFDHLERFLDDNGELFTIVSPDFGGLFERAWYLRGMTNLLMDFHDNPAFVEDLLDELGDYYVATIEILGSYRGIDGVCVVDDYGIQDRLFFAPEMWRRFFKPRLVRIVDTMKKHNLVPHLHSCGCVCDIIEDLIEIGIRILDPVQPEAMDIRDVKEKFGGRIAFLGGFSTQQVIPHGTEQEVRRHVRERIEILGGGGGYIASNGIPIQTDVPLENVLTIIDALKNQ